MRIRALTLVLVALTVLALLAARPAASADWQYRVPVERSANPKAKAETGSALLWIPPNSATVHGLLLMGQLLMESEFASDPSIRQACADGSIAILYFEPHISALFHFWEPGSRDGERLLAAIDNLAVRSGHPELRRVPWITAGHSTAGIFSRNVAYWMPARVAAVVHIKSGNYHQQDHLPPEGSLAGVPLLAINGQFEIFGPEGGIRPELGRETQWELALRDLQQFRTGDPEHLVSLLVEPGADHFHGTPELAQYVALFLTKTARYRLPRALPAGSEPVGSLPMHARDGWLTDPDLRNPVHAPAPYSDYTGEKALALWHYDGEMARAYTAFEANFASPQAISEPALRWLDTGDGWTFHAEAQWLDRIPQEFGGRLGRKAVGHTAKPISFRALPGEPVVRLSADTFRLLRPAKAANIAAYSPGDDRYASTIRWSSLPMAAATTGARSQSIDFPPIADLPRDVVRQELHARATSGLPVYYEVDYGPVRVERGHILVDRIQAGARFPLECKITANQIGRRTGDSVAPAAPVSQVFHVVAAH